MVAWLRADPLASHRGRLDPAQLAELAHACSRRPPLGPTTRHRRPRRQPTPNGGGCCSRLSPGPFWLAAAALLVADDLHWADQETCSSSCTPGPPAVPVLVVATARREELDLGHPVHDLLTGLRALERVAEVEVGRLSRQETAGLAERLGGRPLQAPDVDRLFAETEGNPLFVVEALRAGWSGHDASRRRSPRVQAVIESRLAQLSAPARDLAGVAAAIGREFSTDVLAQASEAGEAALVGGLDELWRRLVRDQGPTPDFTHDRIGRSPPPGPQPGPAPPHPPAGGAGPGTAARRRPGAGGRPGRRPPRRAGQAAEAVDWYQRAAAAAQRLPAYAEAVRLLERALRLHRGAAGRVPRERGPEVLTRLQGTPRRESTGTARPGLPRCSGRRWARRMTRRRAGGAAAALHGHGQPGPGGLRGGRRVGERRCAPVARPATTCARSGRPRPRHRRLLEGRVRDRPAALRGGRRALPPRAPLGTAGPLHRA